MPALSVLVRLVLGCLPLDHSSGQLWFFVSTSLSPQFGGQQFALWPGLSNWSKKSCWVSVFQLFLAVRVGWWLPRASCARWETGNLLFYVWFCICEFFFKNYLKNLLQLHFCGLSPQTNNPNATEKYQDKPSVRDILQPTWLVLLGTAMVVENRKLRTVTAQRRPRWLNSCVLEH